MAAIGFIKHWPVDFQLIIYHKYIDIAKKSLVVYSAISPAVNARL